MILEALSATQTPAGKTLIKIQIQEALIHGYQTKDSLLHVQTLAFPAYGLQRPYLIHRSGSVQFVSVQYYTPEHAHP